MPRDPIGADEFTAAFAECGRALWLIAAAWVGRQEAQDLVQEAARIAWQKRVAFAKGSDFAAFVAQIVRHTGANWRRKRRPETGAEVGEPAAPDEVPTTNAFDADAMGLSDDVANALSALPEVQRAALLLHVVGGYGFAEIGSMLEVPENTATSHARRARLALREALATRSAPVLRRLP